MFVHRSHCFPPVEVPLSQYYRVHSDSHIRTLRLDWKDTGAQKCRSPPRAAPGNNVAARPRSCPASRLAVHKGHYGPEMRVARCSRIYKPVTSCRVCPGPPGYQAAKNSCRIWHGSERTVSCGSLRVRRPSDIGPLIEGHGKICSPVREWRPAGENKQFGLAIRGAEYSVRQPAPGSAHCCGSQLPG